jgi:hypothetical protein
MSKSVFFIAFVLLFVACSSPESDGKKAAEEFCDCEKESVENRQKEYSALIQDFDSYHFQTRAAVRKKIQQIADEAAKNYSDCLQKAQENYHKARRKYATNYQANTQFEYAFQGYRAANAVTDETVAPLISQIDHLMLSIIPSKPDLEKIKRDLIGRKITEQPDGYYHQDWYWKIEDGEIKDIRIISENKQRDDYLFKIRLVLQADGGAHEALVNLTYVLRKNDEWTIDFIESKQVNVVKTGKYNNCISVQKKGWTGEYELEFTNHCDVPLVVGGAVLSEFKQEWHKFSTVIKGSSTKRMGGLFSISVLDYQIHFIEKPVTTSSPNKERT